MTLELTMRHGTIKAPLLVVPTPDFKLYRRQDSSDTQLSPSDTPRKNKRKLSEPKRRTTDFSIKRFCPDSPGSACSESGQSEESANERLHDESGDSVSASPTDLTIERDRLLQHHPHLRPPFMYPSEIPHHPYLVPPFYYGALPGYPPPVNVAGYQNLTSPPVVPVPSVHPQQVLKPQPQRHSRHSSQEVIKTINSTTNATKSRASPSPSPVSSNRHASKEKEQHVSQETPQPPRADSPKQEEVEDNSLGSPDSPKDGKRCRKNYKNMTRERRVEANARERTRVHTISAAFDGLRRAVPSYSYNQKLSKLAILRIACSYINALMKLADPENEDTSSTPESTFAECVDTCTRTIQTEGKARRRH